MDYYDRMRFTYLLLPLLLAACAGLHTQDASATADPKRSALDGPLFYELLLGELSALSDDPDAGFSLMLDAARKTGDPAVYRRAVEIALRARSGNSALLAARAWSQALPNSREAHRFVLHILIGLNRPGETLEPLKRTLALTPAGERADLIWSLPAAYERVSDHRRAADVVDKALGEALHDKALGPTAWATMGRLWLAAGDKAAALDAAEKGLAMDRKAERPALLALSMMGPGQPRAEELLRTYLPGASPQFRMTYVKALLSQRREQDAAVELQSITIQHPDYADAWLIEGILALQSGQLNQAEQHLQRYLGLVDATPQAAQPPEFKHGRTQAFLALSQIAQQRKDTAQAEAWLQKVDNPDDVLRAQLRRATLMADQGHIDEALTLIDSQPVRSADDARLKRSVALQLLRDHKLFDRARTMLETAITENPDDLDLVYDLAMVDEQQGRLDEMERLLRQLILKRPDDPQAYNALGYSLADRNLRLAEARQLVTKALQLAPNDPFITDSLAWVEFRSGNKDEALRLLQQAYRDRPDAEIAAHLGEVLWTLGRHDEAVDILRQGHQLNPGNATLLEAARRLGVTL